MRAVEEEIASWIGDTDSAVQPTLHLGDRRSSRGDAKHVGWSPGARYFRFLTLETVLRISAFARRSGEVTRQLNEA